MDRIEMFAIVVGCILVAGLVLVCIIIDLDYRKKLKDLNKGANNEY